MRIIGMLIVLGVALAATASGAQPAQAPQVSEWNGYPRLDFTVADRPCLVVFPKQPAPGNPWIWRTEFFGVEPQVDLALLARGWHVAYMDARDLYGGPKAMVLFNQFYAWVVVEYQLAPRMVLEGFSRGGLYAFNFAAAHPNRVAAMYLDAPVLDIRSWPGRNPASKEWAECLAAYGLSEETVPAFRGNPLNRIPQVASGHVPIIAVCGDADTVVPFPENTALLEKRYRELGEKIQVILKPGGDHHPHSLKDPAPIVDFLVNNAKF